MHFDAADLNAFYATPLGQTVRRILKHRIRARWRTVSGCTVAGLGYAIPYLGAYRAEAACVAALMPASQGALVWPATGRKLSALVEETALPVPDNSIDRLIAVHCLEAAGRPETLMREIWRVLAPEGRLIIVAPNRRGLWARFDGTPFGQGRPFSRNQIEDLLRGALFTPIDCFFALYMPPFGPPAILRSATAWERFGARISPAFAGVIIVEARKELFAPIGKTENRVGQFAPLHRS